VAEVDLYVDAHQLARERFDTGQREDEVTQKYLAGHDGSERVVRKIAQERATAGYRYYAFPTRPTPKGGQDREVFPQP